MQTKRIIFTGAQGTGKTTILKMFRAHEYPVITEVVRNLVKEKGISINKNGTDKTQQLVFDTYKTVLSEKDAYVSDRGLTDVLAYTIDGVASGKVDKMVAWDQLAELKDFIEANPDIAYIYFPIEFPVVDDGVRSMDEDYRKAIDTLIHKTLHECGIEHLEVHGTPGERFNQILEYVGLDLC